MLIDSNQLLICECDSVWRIAWTKRFQNNSKVAYYKFDIFDCTKGWALKPNLRNVAVFDNKTLNSNSKGIRGKLEYNYDKTPNKIRILVIGDSLTFGDEVSDNETYSYYLRQMLPEAEVINFGIHGYGHDQMLIYLREEGIKYNPDIVILGFAYCDVYRNILEFRDYSKPKFELVKNRLKLKNSPVHPPEVIIKREFYRSKFIDLLNILYRTTRFKIGLDKKKTELVTSAILDEMIATINNIGATPVLIYLPAGTELPSGAEMINANEKLNEGEKYLFRYCKNKEVHCMSLLPYFVSYSKKGIKFNLHGHWKAKTHLIAAETIKEYLLNKNLLKLLKNHKDKT